MWITHSFIGTTKENMRCLFFLLFEDYLEEQSQFARELNLEIERFARNLGDFGAVVRPFSGDIESSRSHIMEKNWSDKEKEELKKTPSLLMIDKDFDSFDPQNDPWLLFHFGERKYEGIPGAYRFKEPFATIVSAVSDGQINPFEIAHNVQHEVEAMDAVKLFEAKPGAFGFSVDLIKAGELLSTAFKRFRH